MFVSIAPGLRRGACRSAWASVLAFAAFCHGTALAYETDPDSQYKTYLTKAQTIDPVGDFGEQVSLRAGTLSFRNVDIELPGTGPTIRIVRSAQLEDGYGTRNGSGNGIGGWEFEIPRMKTVVSDPDPSFKTHPLSAESPIGWQVSGPDKNARCANFGGPPDVTYPGTIVEFPASKWWFGYQMVDDTGGEQALFLRTPEMKSQAQYKIGTSANWVVTCLPNTANGQPGEAFLATAPDGTKYWFDYLTYTGYESLILAFENAPPKDDTLNFSMPRQSASMLVTRVEDRFGNWVTYSYTGTQLTGIDASDGRKVVLQWQPGSVQITAGSGSDTRTWSYGAGVDGYSLKVSRPDGSFWGYAGDFWMPLTSPYEYSGCSQQYLDEPTGSRQVSVTAPSGATATFLLNRRHFGRSYVPKWCSTYSIMNPDAGYALVARLWIGYALTTKTVIGPGLPTRVWNYTYSAHNGSWAEDCPNPASCPSAVWTQVQEPDGSKTVSFFSNKWDQTENKLVKEETYTAGNTLLRTVEYAYATTPSNAPNPYAWPLKIGLFTNYNANGEVDLRWTPLTHKKITQQGVVFNWQATDFDDLARALSVTRSSTLGYSRTDATAYYDHLTKWVLGQVASPPTTTPAWSSPRPTTTPMRCRGRPTVSASCSRRWPTTPPRPSPAVSAAR